METISYSPGDILRETTREISKSLGGKMDKLTVEKTVIGLFFTGVKLSNEVGGVCFTPIKAIPQAVCCPSSARAMPASGKLKNRGVTQFLDEMFSDNPLKRTMGIAVLNALSTVCWREKRPESYEIKIGVDALDELTIPEEGFVVVVGALVPAIKALKQRGKPFGILELDPLTLKEDELEFFVPIERASETIPKADYLIITGTTLINDTLEELLRLKKADARVVVLGPTASMLPEAFFRRGVDVLGGIMVTDADQLLDLISEAGSGYHFFGKGAERVVIQAVGSQKNARGN